MKAISCLVTITLFCVINVSPCVAAATAVQREEDPLVTAMMPDADVETMLSAYSVWTGKKVDVSPEVKRLKTRLELKFDRIKRSEAIQRVERALLEQAGVEIVRKEDGSLLARLAAARGK
jgi:hypothetical protein